MALFGGFAKDYTQGERSAKTQIYRSNRDATHVSDMFPSLPHGLGHGNPLGHGIEDIRRVHELGRPVGLERVTRPEDIARPDRIRDVAFGRGFGMDEVRRAFSHLGGLRKFGKKGGGGIGSGPGLQTGYGSFAIHAAAAAKFTTEKTAPDPINQPYKPLSKQPFGIG
jgi:hypothetical protein